MLQDVERDRLTPVDQELLTPPEHQNSLPVSSGVRVTRSLSLCVCVIEHCTWI